MYHKFANFLNVSYFLTCYFFTAIFSMPKQVTIILIKPRLASVHLIYIITFIIIFNYEKKSSSKNSFLSDSQI